jgi:anti-sigma B factor antagonist
MRDWKTAGPLLRIKAGGRPGEAVLRCAGEIDLSTVPILEQALASSIAGCAPVIEVDLSRIDYLDSCTIYAVLLAHRELASAGRALRVRVSPWGLRLFRLLGLDELMEVRPA